MFYHRLFPELINSPVPRHSPQRPWLSHCDVMCVRAERSQDNFWTAGFLLPSFCALWDLNSSRQTCTVSVFTRWAILPALWLLYWLVKWQLYFPEFLSLHGFELGLTMRKTCTLPGKQKWNGGSGLPSEGHLVNRTDKRRALSASPGRPAPNSRPGASIALRWRAPALSNYHNIIWCWEKGVEAGIEKKKNFMRFLKIKATW